MKHILIHKGAQKNDNTIIDTNIEYDHMMNGIHSNGFLFTIL
jgi:hypothetical protein